MTTMLEALGLDPDPTTDDFRPYLVNATVTAVNADTVAMTFTHAGHKVSGVLPVTEQPPGATWEIGKSVTVVLCEPVTPGSRPRLSAIRREIVAQTLASLSPEVREGRVRIMGVARKPGARTKVAVASTVADLDPVAACVGRAHNRVDGLRAALGGEQVDIVAWHPDKETFLRNALQPAAIGAIAIDEAERTATATAPAHQMSAAVGQGGLNSALAGKLVGLMVKIVPA